MSRFARVCDRYPDVNEKTTNRFASASHRDAARTGGMLREGVVAIVAATLAVTGSVLWHATLPNARAQAPLAVAHVDPQTALTLSAVREEMKMIKAQLALDEDMLREYRFETRALSKAKAPATRALQQSAASQRPAHSAVQPQTGDLQQSLKQMKEMSDYAREVAATVGALDKAMSDPQFLEKRAADLKKAVAHP